MNIFKRILGEISGKNLTGSEGKPQIFQSRRISTMANREICLKKFLKKRNKFLALLFPEK